VDFYCWPELVNCRPQLTKGRVLLVNRGVPLTNGTIQLVNWTLLFAKGSAQLTKGGAQQAKGSAELGQGRMSAAIIDKRLAWRREGLEAWRRGGTEAGPYLVKVPGAAPGQVPCVGAEHPQDSSGNPRDSDLGGAKCGALGASEGHFDPDLAVVTKAWPFLSVVLKAGIVAMVKAAHPE